MNHKLLENNACSDLFDYFPDATFAIDLQGRVIAWNQAMEDITGISAADMLGRGDHEYALPFLGARQPMLIDLVLKWDEDAARRYKYVKRRGAALECEIEDLPLRPKPSLFWSRARMLCAAGGTPMGAVEVMRDITDRLQHDRALKERDDRLQMALSGSKQGIWEWDYRRRELTLDARCKEIFGVDTDPPEVPERYARALHPDDLKRIVSSIAMARKLGTEFDEVLRIFRPDGSMRWVMGRGRAFLPLHGEDYRITGTLMDVTGRKHIEEALREANRRLSATIESITDAYIAMDKSGRLLEINATADQRIFGGRGAQLVGRNIWEEFPEARKSDFFRNYEAALDSGCPVHFEAHSAVADGWFEAHAYPRDGRLEVFLRDITERKRSEAALRESEERFRTLADNISQFAWMADPTGRIVWFNKRWLDFTGGTLEEMVGWGWTKVQHPDHLERVVESFRRSLQSGTAWEDIMPLRGKEGEYRWFLSNAQPIFDDAGRIVRWFGTNTDITERLRYEEALKSARDRLDHKVRERTAELEARNREFRELAHKTIRAMENDRKVLSKELHDSIGGNLAALIYQLQARIEKMSATPPKEMFTFEKMLEHLQGTIRETRFISKRLRPSVLDDFGLTAAVLDTIRDFNEFYPGIRIVSDIRVNENEFADDVKTVAYRVIQEALNNVARHSQADSVSVRLNLEGDFLHLQVRDNGIGFDYPPVFSQGVALTGYGLTSMKERVEICRGRFRVESAPGKGTSVEASIPCSSPEGCA